jgi:hypothetical protein
MSRSQSAGFARRESTPRITPRFAVITHIPYPAGPAKIARPQIPDHKILERITP